MKTPSAIRVVGDAAFIALSRGMEAAIDAADIGLVSGRRWWVVKGSKTYYAQCTIGGKKALLHRVLNRQGARVDHRDGDGLNCRRLNIRPATHAQNQRNRGAQRNNTSGFKGVHWAPHVELWRARICVDGLSICLGYHREVEDAAGAYRVAAAKYHGDFART